MQANQKPIQLTKPPQGVSSKSRAILFTSHSELGIITELTGYAMKNDRILYWAQDMNSILTWLGTK